MPDIRYAQNENVDRGDLRMQVIERGTSTPIDDAKISISYSGDPDSTVEEGEHGCFRNVRNTYA